MKRLVCFISSLILLVTLCSCSKEQSANAAILSGISFTATVTKDSQTQEFLVRIAKNGDCELLFTKDGEPTDVGIVFSKNGATCFLNGTQLETNVGLLSDGLYSDFIYSTFNTARNSEVKYANGIPIIEGSNNKYDFVISLSGSGLPLSLEENRLGITCIFKNATLT